MKHFKPRVICILHNLIVGNYRVTCVCALQSSMILVFNCHLSWWRGTDSTIFFFLSVIWYINSLFLCISLLSILNLCDFLPLCFKALVLGFLVYVHGPVFFFSSSYFMLSFLNLLVRINFSSAFRIQISNNKPFYVTHRLYSKLCQDQKDLAKLCTVSWSCSWWVWFEKCWFFLVVSYNIDGYVLYINNHFFYCLFHGIY